MTKLTILLLFVIAAALALADQQQVRIYGPNFPANVAFRLQALLGKGYSVKREPIRISELKVPSSVILDLSPKSGDWDAWLAEVDGFVPKVRAVLKEVRAAYPKARIILVVPPTVERKDVVAQQLAPLLKQAARESGTEAADLSNSEDMVQDLFALLVAAQRNPGTWRLVSATSEQIDEGPASSAIDNNPETYWHTRYDPNPTKVPHEIIIDLGKSQALQGFSYLARQDGGINGRVKDFEIFLSDNPNTWASPVMTGTLQSILSEQRLFFARPAAGRYLRFRALTEVNGNIWTSMAELGIIVSGTNK